MEAEDSTNCSLLLVSKSFEVLPLVEEVQMFELEDRH